MALTLTLTLPVATGGLQPYTLRGNTPVKPAAGKNVGPHASLPPEGALFA